MDKRLFAILCRVIASAISRIVTSAAVYNVSFERVRVEFDRVVYRKPLAFIGNVELAVYDENKRSERGVKLHGQVKHRAGSTAMSLPEQVHAQPTRQRHSNGNKRGDHGIAVDFCGDLTTRGPFSGDLRRLDAKSLENFGPCDRSPRRAA